MVNMQVLSTIVEFWEEDYNKLKIRIGLDDRRPINNNLALTYSFGYAYNYGSDDVPYGRVRTHPLGLVYISSLRGHDGDFNDLMGFSNPSRIYITAYEMLESGFYDDVILPFTSKDIAL